MIKYKNGNYNCILLEDGTKIRYNKLSHFEPLFPESIDCKITNQCFQNCEYCHEQSNKEGKHANLNHPIFNSLHAGTELAIGGGNILLHPNIVEFLGRMREQDIICNITINLNELAGAYSTIKYWSMNNLVHGVGISIDRIPTPNELMLLRQNPNFVVHVIAGIVTDEIINTLSDCNLKILILGYKNFGRGINYLEKNPSIQERINELARKIPILKSKFKLISFDNLALKQLNIKEVVDEDEWNLGYMGEDGQFTMYLDMVNEEFAVSSTSARKPIFSNNIIDLFKEVQNDK